MSLKRRSTEKAVANDTKCFAKDEKSSVDYFDDIGSEYFHTQIINKIAEDEKNATGESSKSNLWTGHEQQMNEYHGFTQTLSESQFEDTITPGQRFALTQIPVVPNGQRTNEYRIHSFTLQQNKLNTSNAKFNDDEELDEAAYELQSSQIFLDDVSKLNTNIDSDVNISINNSISINYSQLNLSKFDGFDVSKNNKTFTEYLQLQRSMNIENEHNVNECDLSQLLNDCYQTQYQQEVENAFNECEKTIKDLEEDSVEKDDEMLGNMDLDGQMLEKMAKENKLNAKDLAEVSVIPPPKEFSSDNFKKPIGTAQPPRLPVTTSTFCILGPFFGLPKKVQRLIKEYKGIDELYGKFDI